MTLNVTGTMISGMLMGSHKYLESAKRLFVGTPGWDAGEGLVKGFAESLAEDCNEEEEYEISSLIHLKNAKFYTPGKNPIPADGAGVLWRGKLSSVDEYTFGTLSLWQGLFFRGLFIFPLLHLQFLSISDFEIFVMNFFFRLGFRFTPQKN